MDNEEDEKNKEQYMEDEKKEGKENIGTWWRRRTWGRMKRRR